MDTHFLLPLSVAFGLCVLLPLLVFKWDFRGDAGKASIKLLAASGLFAVGHLVVTLVLAWVMGMCLYMGWAAIGGGANSLGGFLATAAVLAAVVDLALSFGLVAAVQAMLQLTPRARWLPLLVCSLLIGLEGLTVFLVADQFQPRVRSGYINKSGYFVIRPEFRVAQPFSKGVARVYPSDRVERESAYFIDHSGKKTVANDYSPDVPTSVNMPVLSSADPGEKVRHGEYSEGLAAAQVLLDEDGNDPEVSHKQGQPRWGYIGPDGKWRIKPAFSTALPFREGLAVVSVWKPQPDIFGQTSLYENRKQLFGYIDKSGKYVIPPVFDEAGSFSEGLASVTLDVKKWPRELPQPK